jgi:hypothetical protein
MVVYVLKIWYGIGHTIAAFQINMDPINSLHVKGQKHMAKKTTYLINMFSRKVPHINKPLCYMSKLYFKLLLVT